jgi:hypothetical protein
MDTTKSDAPAGASASSPPANANSPVRLLVLLGILVVALGALAYDHFVAKPGVEEAYNKIERLIVQQNESSAVDSMRLTSAAIQKEIGKAPTKVIKEDDYTVEYYCWWGPVPFLNTYRQYITVVFVGDDPRRLNSHHMNEYPPAELLSPAFWEIPAGEDPPLDGPSPMPGPMTGGMPPGGEGADDGAAPKGGGKKGKKGKAADAADPAADQEPSAETPPSDDAPPAEETVEPATPADDAAEVEPQEPADAADTP